MMTVRREEKEKQHKITQQDRIHNTSYKKKQTSPSMLTYSSYGEKNYRQEIQTC